MARVEGPRRRGERASGIAFPYEVEYYAVLRRSGARFVSSKDSAVADEAGQPISRIGPKADKDLTNAEKIIFGLRDLHRTIATAESMTAGGFGCALTRVPGSSRVYLGGVLVYTRRIKKQLLGIPDELLDKGLVTPELTLAMAQRVIEIFGAHYAVAGTGNAGPTSDEGGASIGRVYWVVTDVTGNTNVSSFDFFGKRDEVRRKAVTAGLRMLRNFIEKDQT